MKETYTEVPTYVFLGFLEGGKTTFIQDTLEDKRFFDGEKTLLLVCEEGEAEYDSGRFASKDKDDVVIVPVEDEETLTPEFLGDLQKKYDFGKVIVEYNGVWGIDALFGSIPEEWAVAQIMTLFDAETFLNYNQNMRQLVYEKIQVSDMVVFNRFRVGGDVMPFHKVVRAISRQCEIVYEDKEGRVKMDDIVDPLPFDVNAPIVEISDRDFAIWYADLSDDVKKYVGKTVKFKGMVAHDRKLPQTEVAIGRYIMQCCQADIQFYGMISKSKTPVEFKDKDWVTVTGVIGFAYHKAYGGKGPVMEIKALEAAEAPEEQVATFY